MKWQVSYNGATKPRNLARDHGRSSNEEYGQRYTAAAVSVKANKSRSQSVSLCSATPLQSLMDGVSVHSPGNASYTPILR